MIAPTLIALGIDFAVVIMAIAWYIAKRINNADLVEPARATVFLVVSGLYASQGEGDPVRKTLLGLMFGIWSLWRGITLTSQMGKTEGPARAFMRERFAKRPWLMFFAHFEMQAIIVGLLVMAPFAGVFSHKGPVGLPEWVGAAIWLAGMAGLLTRPKSARSNLLLEMAVWVGYFVFALGTPWGWISAYCPLLMLFLLTQARWYAR